MQVNPDEESTSFCDVRLQKISKNEIYIFQDREISKTFPSEVLNWLDSSSRKVVTFSNFRLPINETEKNSIRFLLMNKDIDILVFQDIYISLEHISDFLLCVFRSLNSFKNCLFSSAVFPKLGLNLLNTKLDFLKELSCRNIESDPPHYELLDFFKQKSQALEALSLQLGAVLYPLTKMMNYSSFGRMLTSLTLRHSNNSMNSYIEVLFSIRSSVLMSTLLNFSFKESGALESRKEHVYIICSLLDTFVNKIKLCIVFKNVFPPSASLFISNFSSNSQKIVKNSIFADNCYTSGETIHKKLSILSFLYEEVWDVGYVEVYKK
eukprot:snap_masked-scaffold_30-processed-gene-1.23-mRNA-1 protein AED:1.00 eAED:1.00 QI:0/-1/0/0/-1/1/1/0/321